MASPLFILQGFSAQGIDGTLSSKGSETCRCCLALLHSGQSVPAESTPTRLQLPRYSPALRTYFSLRLSQIN